MSTPLAARIMEIRDGCQLAAKRLGNVTGQESLDRERMGAREAYSSMASKLTAALRDELRSQEPITEFRSAHSPQAIRRRRNEE